MGDVTRRAATLALLLGISSCKSVDDLRVDLVVRETSFEAFEAGLSRFARDRGLREREHAAGEYNFGGRGIDVSVLSSPPANGEIELSAFFIKGLFSLASAQQMRDFAYAFVEAMNSIDGVTATDAVSSVVNA